MPYYTLYFIMLLIEIAIFVRRKSFRTSSPGSEAAMSPGVDKQDRKRRLSRQKSMMEEAEELKKNVEKKQKEKLIEEEKSETGGVCGTTKVRFYEFYVTV